MADTFLYVHIPAVKFRARVNMAGAITYPLTSLVFDTVTVGAFGDIVADMTLLLGTTEGADDLGRTRVQKPATSTAIPLMETSRGIEDGELTVQDNAYITVWEDFRVWSKIPGFSDDGTIQYKDTNEPVGTHTTTPPPVANCGPGVAATINSGTSLITVQFVGTTSLVIADGATITTYAWDVKDGTITVGTSASSTITATFPAGFRWVALTVTDSNGKSHTSRCPVYARNPAADTTIKNFAAETTISHTGQTLQLQIFEELLRSTYPDGTLVMLWEGEPATAADRSNMQFIGWIQTDEADVRAVRTGNERETRLTCVDVAGRLASLPGFPQSLEKHATPNNWDKMVAPNIRKYIHYLIQWHSTAVSLTDVFIPTYIGTDYPFVIFASEGESLYDQIENEAKAIVPTHHFTCNRLGQLSVVADPMLQDSGDRTATVQAAFSENYTATVRFAHTRPPKVHWLRGHAIIASTDYTVVDLENQIMTVHCIAPGLAAGQGLNERETPEGITVSQSSLNTAKGHEYARLNSRYGPISVTPPDDDPYLAVEPANMTWVTLTVTAATAAQRGLTFATVRCLPKEIRRRWQTTRTGVVRRSEFTLEVETSGVAAVTSIPEGSDFVPPLPNDPEYYYDDIKAYIMWDGATVVRTWDLQAASPTWEEIGASLSGTVYDVQYMHVDAATVGAWCMTSTGIYFCANIMAATPTWSEKLTIATVRATAVAPASGLVIFASMTHYWLQPGHLCVAMSLDTENDDYIHCYYWVTTNYGASWTPVDHDDDLFTSDGATRAYYECGRYSLASFRSTATLWCGRGNGRTSINNGDGAVFKSTDGGLTWTKEYVFAGGRVPSNGQPAILNPFPDATDPTYLAVAIGGTSPVGQFHKSTSGWSAGAQIAEPAGHSGGFSVQGHLQRPNKDPFRDDHVIAIFAIDASSNGDLYESTDGGANWTLLEGLGNSHVTPNGWPADPLQWVLINNTSNAAQIQLTLDNFATLLNRTGNLASVITWTQGTIAGGFALPRLAPNV